MKPYETHEKALDRAYEPSRRLTPRQIAMKEHRDQYEASLREALYEITEGRHICFACQECPADIRESLDTPDGCFTAKELTDAFNEGKKENGESEDNYVISEKFRDYYIVTKCSFFKPLTDRDRYYLYIKSPEWREKRKKQIERDGFRCVICGSPMNLQVHHISYERLGAEPPDDLVTLCKVCHEKLHAGKLQLPRGGKK